MDALVFLLISDAIFSQMDLDWGDPLVNICLLTTIFIAVWTVEENQGKWLKAKIAITNIVAALMLSDLFIISDALEIYILPGLIWAFGYLVAEGLPPVP